MRLALKLKILLVIFLIFLSGILLLPTFVQDLPSWFYKFVHRGQLRLGLDLKGGVHLVLKPDVDRALQNQFENNLQELFREIDKQGFNYEKVIKGLTAQVFFNKFDEAQVFKMDILSKYKELVLLSEKKEDQRYYYLIGLSEERQNFIRENLVNQLLEVLRNRIDQFGVTEPIITKQGKDKVVIQLPGIKDPERALKIIGQTAQLEFKLVDDEAAKRIDLNALISTLIKEGKIKDINNLEEWRRELKPYIPEDREFYFELVKDKEAAKRVQVPLLLSKETLLTGEYIKNAQVRIDPTFNEPYVWIQFNDRGAKIFEAITGANVGRRLAIVLDDVVRSAPVIREKIAGGEAQITGSFSMEEAQDLALVLRAGALPAPVKILQNITIGPSLGKDSIERSIKAGLLGALIVIIFTVIYYKISGIIAVVALVLNIYYLVALLSAFQATLTLPGIAGIILSIGMGIDSNVLIFERIREELRIGRSAYSAIFTGYSRAFWTIFDAHITVLITALILFLFGTGPIRGFAITLSLSIIINLFTAIFITKIYYEFLYNKGKEIKLSFLTLLEKPNFNFMKYKRFFSILSIVLLLVGFWGFIFTLLGKANLGVDFTGGTILYLKTGEPQSLDKIRDALRSAGFSDISLQEVKGENLLLLKFKSGKESLTEEVGKILQVLQSKLASKKFEVIAKEEIGGVISKELKNKAIFAILGALLGITIYLTFRFISILL